MNDVTMLHLRTRKPTSAFIVSMWYLPGGYDVANAKVITGYFDAEEREEAERITASNADAPEYAVMTSIEDFDRLYGAGKANVE